MTLAVRWLIWGPIVLSILIPPATSSCDYIVQGGLLFALIAVPASSPPGTGFGLTFLRLYGLSMAWGLWRMLYADAAMDNDVPAMAYFVVGIPWILLFSGATWTIRALWHVARNWRETGG